MKADGLIVVGGSYAALNLALSARDSGYGGPIRILSEEGCLPYFRPPLSKSYLTGAADASELPMKSERYLREKDIEVSLNTSVAKVNRIDRAVTTADGERITYDHLALAVGTRPRKLDVPGCEGDGIHYLKTQQDADAIRSRLGAVGSVVVIGGGFIGLETAAALRTLGKSVTLIEAMDRVVARAGTPVLADFLSSLHEQNGVEILCSRSIAGFDLHNGHVAAVLDDQGTRHPADLVIVGIGVIPNVELAQAAGLHCNNGIEVDEFGVTSDGFIYASGDCTSFISRYADGRSIRLECVQNASEQARATGAAIALKRKPYDAVPWFWSDQFGHKIQMAGLASGYDCVARRPGKAEGAFTTFYFKAGRLIAADSIDSPADHLMVRRLLAAGTTLTPRQAEDPGVELRNMLGTSELDA